MKKILTTAAFGIVLSTVLSLGSNYITNNLWKNIEYKSNTLTIFSNNKNNNKVISNDKNGKWNSSTYVTYIDSSSDTYKPNKGDIVLVDAHPKPATWIKTYIPIVTFKISDFAKTKNDFINKMKNFTINYQSAYNLWDSRYGWLNKKERKNPSFGPHSINPNFNGKNQNKQLNLSIWKKEGVEITLITNWNDKNNTVSLTLEMGNWYNWQSLSIYNHAALLKIKFNDFKNESKNFNTTSKFNNTTHLQTGSLNIEEGASLTINLQNLFDDAKKLFKEAKTNNYTSWGILNAGIIMAGANGGVTENKIWFDALIFDKLFLPSLIKDLQLTAHGIFTADNNPEIIIAPVIEGETSYISAYYHNGIKNERIFATDNSEFVPGVYINLYGMTIMNSMYFIKK